MWWECSECGAHRERARRPIYCRECGTAGVIFSPVEPEEVEEIAADPRRTWVEIGTAWPAARDQIAA